MEEPTHTPGRDESARIHHPHDKLAKHAFSDIPTAVALFRNYLPQRIVRLLDFDKLTLEPGTYIDEAYKQTASDLLFSVPYKEKTKERAFLYLLFEHLSSEKPWTPFQLLLYKVDIWKDWRRKHPSAKKLPLILPIVLAQSGKEWKVPLSFHDLIHLPSPGHKDLLRYIPDFHFELIELVKLPYNKILGTPFGILTMRILKAQPLQQLLSDPVWDEELMAQVQETILEILLYYIANVGDVDTNLFTDRLKRIQNPLIQNQTMTIAEQLRQEGREQALEQTRTIAEQFRQEGRNESLQALLSYKFGQLSIPVMERIQSATPQQLERWTYRILDAQTLEQVFE